MHIAAAEPRFLRREDVTEKDLETEREIARDAAVKSGKPENIVEKMVTGKMEKFYGEACLLEQPYIRDDKATVTQYLQEPRQGSGLRVRRDPLHPLQARRRHREEHRRLRRRSGVVHEAVTVSVRRSDFLERVGPAGPPLCLVGPPNPCHARAAPGINRLA